MSNPFQSDLPLSEAFGNDQVSYFNICFGRSKECYHLYFYSDVQRDIHTFKNHISEALKSTAENLIAQNQTINSDMTLFSKIPDSMAEFGYRLFEPGLISFEYYPYDGNGEKLMTGCRFQHSLSENEVKDDKWRDVFEVKVFRETSQDLTFRYWFAAQNSFAEAVKIASSFIESAKGLDNADRLLNRVCNQLIQSKFSSIPFHSLFYHCNHKNNPHLISIIGETIYTKLTAESIREGDSPAVFSDNFDEPF